MLIEIDDDRINELQRESVHELLRLARGAHYINVHVRKNGRDHHVEADWLWHARIGRKPLRFLDRRGWPVEFIDGRPVLNFFRMLIHTRRITRKWRPPLFAASSDTQVCGQRESSHNTGETK